MRLAILAHDRFPHRAKTAIGVMRYGDDDVVAVIDRTLAGTRVREHTELVPDAPIVGDMAAVGPVDALVIGVAPIGGGFEEDWRSDVYAAIERGVDIVTGLHTFLGDDPDFAERAATSGAQIHDVRRPPRDLSVSDGIADQVGATVVLTVGTDASVGKMTTTFELVGELRDRGVDAAPIPTGQTGIMIEGWGYPIDRVVADFIPGAVEELILERGDTHDVLVVEGQGAIGHPAYSGLTCGILHGAMPDAMILCHDHGRDHIHGYDSIRIPSLDTLVELYESLAVPVRAAPIAGLAVDTSDMPTDTRAREELDHLSGTLGIPASDVVRFGADPIVDMIESL